MTAPHAGRVLVILAAGRAKRYGGLKPLAPVGPGGEAIIDLVASDAVTAGFDTIVPVISPETGAAIREHVERRWPGSLDVRFAVQERARGTVDAVLSAWGELGYVAKFGVANADDLYGPNALALLQRHVAGHADEHALVGFRLDRAIIGSSPVTRGVCETDPDGNLVKIDERRGVAPRGDGTFGTGDDRAPEILDPSTIVSMNLWGFSTELGEEFRGAMKHAGDDEVLLPEVVGSLIERPGTSWPFKVLRTDSRCVGVTHPDDLELVQRDVASQVERSERSATLWSTS